MNRSHKIANLKLSIEFLNTKAYNRCLLSQSNLNNKTKENIEIVQICQFEISLKIILTQSNYYIYLLFKSVPKKERK